ncbi:MAG: copper amine oxidase N-terminal domain-containing protein [Moorella humiferrea]|nr:copper amine oxidase N-terminal domain-containing protein [Moorella humiferrea]
MRRGKRFLALLTCLVLLLSFTLPAWAGAGGEKGKAWSYGLRIAAGQDNEDTQDTGDNQEGTGEKIRNEEHMKVQKGKSVAQDVYRGVENALLHVKNPVARAALTAILEGKSVAEAVYEAKSQLDTWKDTGEIAAVAEELEKAVATDTSLDNLTQAQVKKHLGIMYLKANKFKKARALLEEVVAAASDDKEAYEQLDAACAAEGDYQFKVFLKGKALQFDVPPRIEGGRVLIPVRFLAQGMGAEVNYDNGTVTITNKGITIRLVIGSNQAQVDGMTVYLDVPAKVVDGRTLVPLRFVAEGFNARVDYYGGSNLVAVQTT